MGANPIGSRKVVYMNAVYGFLRVGKDEYYESFTGIITKVRVVENRFDGKLTWRLETWMIDLESESPIMHIISGIMYNADGSVGTWGRMLVQRLAKPETVGRRRHFRSNMNRQIAPAVHG